MQHLKEKRVTGAAFEKAARALESFRKGARGIEQKSAAAVKKGFTDPLRGSLREFIGSRFGGAATGASTAPSQGGGTPLDAFVGAANAADAPPNVPAVPPETTPSSPDVSQFTATPQPKPEFVGNMGGVDVFGSSSRPDGKINQYADARNMATLYGGEAAPPPQKGEAGFGNTVASSARGVSDFTPSGDAPSAAIQGEGVTAADVSASTGGTVSTVPTGVNPFAPQGQDLVTARQKIGLNQQGTDWSPQIKNDAMLRAEGNVDLASNASTAEKSQARRAKLNRDLMYSSIFEGKENKDRREAAQEELKRMGGDLQAFTRAGSAKSEQKARAEEKKQVRKAEALESGLDRTNKIIVERMKQSGLDDRSAEKARVDLIGKVVKQFEEGYSSYPSGKGKEPVPWAQLAPEMQAKYIDDRVRLLLDTLTSIGMTPSGPQQGKAARLVNGKWVDQATGQPIG